MPQYLVTLNKYAKKPLYIQLYEYIKKEIILGNLERNTKMPSIRDLSSNLNVSKNTVENAYQQLNAEGYIISKPKSGYYVAAIDDISTSSLLTPNIQNFSENSTTKVFYDFRSDYTDQESFNFPIWRKYINKALKDNKRFLTYGDNQGELCLRNEVAKYLRQSRGVSCQPEQIIIGAGVQSLLHILCSILSTFFQSAAFEDPGFNKAQYIFRDHGFHIIPIALETDGINIEALAQSKAKIVYVSPSHQFPMGSTMPVKKRNQLLNWAHQNQAIIIEDDYDSELRYLGKPIPSLQGMNGGINVVYLGSFSKILMPSLRISYMVIPPSLLPVYKKNMNKYNQTSSAIEQIALSHFIREGYLDKHIRKLRKLYTKKNQIIVDIIKNTMRDKVVLHGKESGLHLLLEIKTDLDTEQLVSYADKVGIKVIPVSHYYIENTVIGHPQILLSYAGIPKDDIIPAIELLYSIWFGA